MNILKRSWQNRWIRGLGYTLISLVTLYVLLYSWMNWSGARQWQAAQSMLKGEGETLDFRATVPEPIPDAENFCAIPLLTDLALVVDNDSSKGAPAEKRKRLESLKLPSEVKGQPRPAMSNVALGIRADSKSWAGWLRQAGSLPSMPDSGDPNRDILVALSDPKRETAFRELAAGLSRQRAQWAPDWKTRDLPKMLFSIQLPHYAAERDLAQLLALRSIVAVRAADSGTAHQGALIMARLGEADLNDPFLIGLLVGVSDATVLANVVWELCNSSGGKAEDFARLESELAKFDFQRASLQAMRSEMAAAANAAQYLADQPSEAAEILSPTGLSGSKNRGTLHQLLTRAVSPGFYEANGAVLVTHEFRYMIKPLRDEGMFAECEAGEAGLKEIMEAKRDVWTRPFWLMTAMVAPALPNVVRRALYGEVLIDQARIACALERYRITHGSYPDSLEAVTMADGKPTPLDTMNRKPMGYRKTADGKYALWSVGLDRKDDGGRRILDAKHPASTKFSDGKYVGDWVWDFPAQ